MIRLKELRKKEGLTLQQLSDILKDQYDLIVSDGQLSNYENEKRKPRDEKVWEYIADHFGVTVGYLLGISKIRTEEQAQALTEAFEEKPPTFIMTATDSDEHDLLYNYRQLKNPYKDHARKVVKDIWELQKENDNQE